MIGTSRLYMQDSTRTVCLKVIFVFDKLLSVALLYLLLPKQDVLHHLLICPSFTAHRSVLLTSVEGLAGTICLRANITKKVQILFRHRTEGSREIVLRLRELSVLPPLKAN